MVLMERAGSAPIGDERQLVGLMVSYQNGDLAAFEQLYAALADEVRRFFERQQRGAARDLLQEAFLELHRSRRTYRPGLPVRPWVYGIARNVLARDRRMLAYDVRAQRSFADPATLAARASAPPAETTDANRLLVTALSTTSRGLRGIAVAAASGDEATFSQSTAALSDGQTLLTRAQGEIDLLAAVQAHARGADHVLQGALAQHLGIRRPVR